MKKLIASLLIFLATAALADTKIMQLPLDSAASTNVNDSFPFVNSVIGETERLLLSDLKNLPALQSQFSLMIPSQTGQNGKCLQSNGTLTLWGACSLGSVTSVGLLDGSTTPIFSISGSPVTNTGSLTFSLKTETANTVFSGPTTGAAAQPGFRALVGADLPAPSSSSLGGIESYASVTNQWLDSISTLGVPHSSQPAFSNVSGQADLTSQVTGALPAGNGGTGQTSIAAAFVSFYESIATALGDIVYGGASGTPTRLAGNTTSTKKFLSQTGTGSVSAAPGWNTIAGSDLPNPSSTTLGGVESYVAVTHQWINTISTSGVPSSTQPACGDLSNSAASCSTDATNATNISSGNLSLTRLPTAVTWPSSATVQSVTPTNHGVVISGSAASATVTAAGASGSVLQGQGSSADPVFSSAPTLGISGTTTGQLKMAGATSGTVTLQSQDTAGTWTLKFPTTGGSNGYFLQTDGTGITTWAATSSGSNASWSGYQDSISGGCSNASATFADVSSCTGITTHQIISKSLTCSQLASSGAGVTCNFTLTGTYLIEANVTFDDNSVATGRMAARIVDGTSGSGTVVAPGSGATNTLTTYTTTLHGLYSVGSTGNTSFHIQIANNNGNTISIDQGPAISGEAAISWSFVYVGP